MGPADWERSQARQTKIAPEYERPSSHEFHSCTIQCFENPTLSSSSYIEKLLLFSKIHKKQWTINNQGHDHNMAYLLVIVP